jgi:hypothetical protein
MEGFDYSDLKNYWKLKINALLAYKGVDVADLHEPNWEEELDKDTLLYRWDINRFAINVCRDIYNSATVNDNDFPDVTWDSILDLIDDAPDISSVDYWNITQAYTEDWEVITKFHFYLLNALKYVATNDDVGTENPWKDLKTLLNGSSLEEVVNTASDFNIGISHILGTMNIPADWETKLVAKADLDTVNAEKAALQVKADEYDRIHAKLSGQVSDNELDNLLTPPPPPFCSHVDYDNIKNERDTARANLTTAQTNLATITSERDTAITEKNNALSELSTKELTIIEKIITDCELGVNTEKTLDKVIARIKELIKDNDTINPTVKNEVITMSKELELGSDFETKLSQITTYSSLIDIQKQAFSSKLSESKSEISKYQTRANWAIGLGSLSFGAALILSYFLLRKKQQDGEGEISEN